MSTENQNRISIILAGQEVGSVALDVDVSHAEHQAALKADNARLATEGQGLEQKLLGLRASIENAEQHLRATEAAIRAADIKRIGTEKELAQLRRKLTEAVTG